MGERRVDLVHFGGGQPVQAIGAVVEGGTGPGGAVLHCAHALCLIKWLREVQSCVEFGATRSLAQRDIHGIGSDRNVAGTSGGRNLS